MSPKVFDIMNADNKWDEFFDKVFTALKIKFKKAYPFKEDGDVSPDIVALKDVIFKLPCAIEVLELRFDTAKFAHIKDETGYILRYDLSKIGEKRIEDYGAVDVKNRDALKAILIDKFSFTESQVTDFVSDFKTIGMWDAEKLEYYIHFAQYDIKKYFDEYLSELSQIFLYNIHAQLIQKFKREISFNSLYNLEKDEVLPLEIFAKKDPMLDNFVRLEDGVPRKITIEDLQNDVCTIQLIPPVPEEVKRIYKAAKDLYVFGFFRYYYFTISQHYAYLAIESAIRHKYNQWLGEKVVLTCKKSNLNHEMIYPSYQRIFEFCRQNKEQGWDYHKLKINGEDFPWKMRLLLDWLLRKGLQTKWQIDRLDLALQFRNNLSHLEFVTIFAPSRKVLELTAEAINRLYHPNSNEVG